MSWAQVLPPVLMAFHLRVSSPIHGAENKGKTLAGNIPWVLQRDLAAIVARHVLYGPG
jgi:hypothetical protein